MRESKPLPGWIKYVSTAAAGVAIALIYCFAKGAFKAEDAADRLRMICDAFTIPGILLLCVGLLTAVNKGGAFDGLAYSFKSMRRVRRNFRADDGTPKSYYDYKESVKGKRKVAAHLIFVGLGFLAVAIALMIAHGVMTKV
ncbi:MAG: DUF3899 domain-containing protein [Clostridia bacterium]|nr:DUF3899 domain-containing protein [Clostridia bacterium]